jgi:threonine dehydrogenase-like Zn-dependent dehydrogenase
MTGGRGVDVAIEALGLQQTFESSLRVVRPGGKLYGMFASLERVRITERGGQTQAADDLEKCQCINDLREALRESIVSFTKPNGIGLRQFVVINGNRMPL